MSGSPSCAPESKAGTIAYSELEGRKNRPISPKSAGIVPAESAQGTKKNGPPEGGPSVPKPDDERVTERDFSGSVRAVLQARRAAQRLMEIDELIADDEPLPLGRAHLEELYSECWVILEAAPSILRDEFEAIVGVKLTRVAFALHAIGWRLLSPAARARRVQLQEKAAPFISPEELIDE